MVFGAGGGTSSYREAEETDLIVLWGSNARETHPIFFHHLLKGIHKGARLYAVDPRRTSSAEWADVWLGLDVGSDIAVANAVGREIIAAGLEDRAFIEHATEGFDAYKAKVESYTLEYAERESGVPADAIRDLAHAFARAISLPTSSPSHTSAHSALLVRRGSTVYSRAPSWMPLRRWWKKIGCVSRALLPQRTIRSVSSASRYELVPPPAPNTIARPATLGACQVRLQLSMLLLPRTARLNFCAA